MAEDFLALRLLKSKKIIITNIPKGISLWSSACPELVEGWPVRNGRLPPSLYQAMGDKLLALCVKSSSPDCHVALGIQGVRRNDFALPFWILNSDSWLPL